MVGETVSLTGEIYNNSTLKSGNNIHNPNKKPARKSSLPKLYI